MTSRSRFLVVMLLIAFTTALSSAQRGPCQGRQRYDANTETKVIGTVEDVQSHTGYRGWTGTHLLVKTDTGTLEVHVGPNTYIEKQQFSFAKGDSIEVTGSKVKMAGNDVLLAREITREGKTLSLRDKNGFPLWSRRGRRS